jgi:hypothetical protein
MGGDESLMKILTALERVAIWYQALDYHSPDAQQPFRVKDHIPSDYDFMDGKQGEPYHPLSDSTQDESQSGKWYHVSPHPLAPGARVVPHGGSSPGGDDFYGTNNYNRQNHVWMSPNINKAKFWQNQDWAQGSHLYEVKPGARPQPWEGSGIEGWVAPHATVTREIT